MSDTYGCQLQKYEKALNLIAKNETFLQVIVLIIKAQYLSLNYSSTEPEILEYLSPNYSSTKAKILQYYAQITSVLDRSTTPTEG